MYRHRAMGEKEGDEELPGCRGKELVPLEEGLGQSGAQVRGSDTVLCYQGGGGLFDEAPSLSSWAVTPHAAGVFALACGTRATEK